MIENKQMVPVELELTDEENAGIEGCAKEAGVTPDEWMRRVTAEAVAERRAAKAAR